MVRKQ